MAKNFKQLAEHLDQQPVTLEESNLARLHSHLQNRNLGIITAHRGNLPADMNVTRNRQLEQHIRQAGYGFIHVDGKYTENKDTPEERQVSERAYLVVGKPGHDHGELKGFLKKHGEAYDQDSVLYKQHDEPHAKLIGTTKRESWLGYGEEQSVGEWHPNRAAEFHSALHNQKVFAFESLGLVETHGSNFFSEWGKYLREKAGQ
jgi:hypothetical protein